MHQGRPSRIKERADRTRPPVDYGHIPQQCRLTVHSFRPMTILQSCLARTFPTCRHHAKMMRSQTDPRCRHALRKSGTYTALDFAPPVRFKNHDTGSDAGSIYSNRTGISAAHLQHIRAGAYRISRLPADTVGTKEDITSNLRPKWDIR